MTTRQKRNKSTKKNMKNIPSNIQNQQLQSPSSNSIFTMTRENWSKNSSQFTTYSICCFKKLNHGWKNPLSAIKRKKKLVTMTCKICINRLIIVENPSKSYTRPRNQREKPQPFGLDQLLLCWLFWIKSKLWGPTFQRPPQDLWGQNFTT